MSRINLQSLNADQAEPKDAIAALLADLQSLAIEVGRKRIVHLSSGDRLVMPRAGIAQIYAVSSMTTTGSDVSNFFTVNVTRNGQAETGVSLDTSKVEVTAYAERHLGVLPVSRGEVIALQVVTTGTLYPILSTANLSLRCEFSPRELN